LFPEFAFAQGSITCKWNSRITYNKHTYNPIRTCIRQRCTKKKYFF